MDDEVPTGADAEPVGTATVLVVIVATMIGFAATVAVLAVGLLDAGMPQLPEIRDDGTDGGGIPNLDPDDLPGDDDTGTTNGSDGAENASGIGPP